jgi:hypothetical protein
MPASTAHLHAPLQRAASVLSVCTAAPAASTALASNSTTATEAAPLGRAAFHGAIIAAAELLQPLLPLLSVLLGVVVLIGLPVGRVDLQGWGLGRG